MAKLIKNAAIYTIGNFLPKMTGFFLLPVYTYYMDPAEYGILSAMTALMGVLNILLILSIPRSIPRLYFDYEEPHLNKVFFGTIFIGTFIIASVQLSLLFIFNKTVESIYKDIPFYPYFKYALFTAYFGAFFSIANSYYRQKGEAGRFIFQNLINFFFMTGGAVLALIMFKNGAESILLGKFYGSLFVFGLTLYLSTRIAVLKFDFGIFKAAVLFSLPLIPANIFAWVLNMSDRIFVERYFELSLVGLYSMAYQIAQLTNLFGTSLRQAYEPWFFKQAKNGASLKAKQNIRIGNNVIIIVLLFIVFFISLFAKDGIYLFLNDRYMTAYIYIPIIAMAVFLGQVAGLLNLGFYQKKKTVSLMWIILASSIINLLFNFLLIPKYGAMGAAWSTLLSFVFNLLLHYFVVKRFYDLMIEWCIIGKYLVIMIASVVYFIYFTPNINLVFLLLIKAILFCSIGLVFYSHNKDILLSIIKK